MRAVIPERVGIAFGLWNERRRHIGEGGATGRVSKGRPSSVAFIEGIEDVILLRIVPVRCEPAHSVINNGTIALRSNLRQQLINGDGLTCAGRADHHGMNHRRIGRIADAGERVGIFVLFALAPFFAPALPFTVDEELQLRDADQHRAAHPVVAIQTRADEDKAKDRGDSGSAANHHRLPCASSGELPHQIVVRDEVRIVLERPDGGDDLLAVSVMINVAGVRIIGQGQHCI